MCLNNLRPKSIKKFIENKLKLKINEEKSKTAKADQVKFLAMTIAESFFHTLKTEHIHFNRFSSILRFFITVKELIVIYTIEMKDFVFILHAFQKKSKSGIATPKQELELLKDRLKEAKVLFKGLTEKNK